MRRTRSRLGRALTHVRRAWHLLPLNWITAVGACACGRGEHKDAGKHPLTDNGVNDASNEEAVIRRWWTEWPEANIGLATGLRSGVCGLDVDPRHDGPASLAKLEAKYGPLPKTLMVRTGSGGHHHLFAVSRKLPNRRGFLPGLDFKADGGYLVAAGSNHLSGGEYEFEDESVPPAPIPDWLVDLVLDRHRHSPSEARPTGDKADVVDEILKGVPEGSRGDKLFEYAVRLRRQNLRHEQAETLILDAAARCKPPFPDAEARRALASAWKEPVGQIEINWLTGEDLLAETLVPPRSFLGEGLIPECGFALLYGVPGIRKTWTILELMVAISRGEPLLGFNTVSTRVGLLELELPKAVVQDRLRQIAGDGMDGLHLPLFAARDSIKGRLNLGDEKTTSYLANLCGDAGVELLVIDALSRVHQADENSAKEFSPVLDGIAALNEAGIAVLLVHHEPKRGARPIGDLEAIRGTSRLQSDPLTCIRLKWIKERELAQLVVAKVNYGATPNPVYLKPTPEGPLVVTQAPQVAKREGSKNLANVRRLLEEAGPRGLYLDEIIAQGELAMRTTQRHLSRLQAVRGENRKFRLPGLSGEVGSGTTQSGKKR